MTIIRNGATETAREWAMSETELSNEELLTRATRWLESYELSSDAVGLELAGRALAMACACRSVHLTIAALHLAEHQHQAGVALLARAQSESVILGHWLLMEPGVAARELVGSHAKSVEKLVRMNAFANDRRIPALDSAAALGVAPSSYVLADVAKICGMETLYNLVYRGESTYAEHGLGAVDHHITAAGPWRFRVSYEESGTPIESLVTVMVNCALIMFGRIVEEAGECLEWLPRAVGSRTQLPTEAASV